MNADRFNTSDVMISYSRRDKDFAREVFDALKADGLEVWADFEDIPFTADWWAEIQAGIEGANDFLFIISPDSARSEVCYKEVQHAVENNKRIVPLLYRDVTDPADQAKMHPVIGQTNWLMFRKDVDTFRPAYLTLRATLQQDLTYVRAHTRLLVRAREWLERRRNPGLLLRRDDLSDAEAWLAGAEGKQPAPLPEQVEYIQASRRAATRSRRIVGALAGGTIFILLIATAVALFQANSARISAGEAVANAATANARGTEVIIQLTDIQNEANIAKQNADLAATNAENALMQELEAQRQQGLAEEEAQRAESEARRALDNAATAEANRIEADRQRQLADINAEEAATNEAEAFMQATEAAEQAARADLSADEAATSEAEALNQAATAQAESTRAFVGEQESDTRALAAYARAAFLNGDGALGLHLALLAAARGNAPQDVGEALSEVVYGADVRRSFNTDGHELVTFSDDGTRALTYQCVQVYNPIYCTRAKYTLWDLNTGDQIHVTEADSATNIYLSGRGTYFVRTEGGLSVRAAATLHDAVTGEERGTLTQLEPGDGRGCGDDCRVWFAPDESQVFGVDSSGDIHKWIVEPTFGYDGTIGSQSATAELLRVSPDGTRTGSLSQNGIILRDTETGANGLTYPEAPNGFPFGGFEFTADSQSILAYSSYHLYRLGATTDVVQGTCWAPSGTPVSLFPGPQNRVVIKYEDRGELWDYERCVRLRSFEAIGQTVAFRGDYVVTEVDGQLIEYYAEQGEDEIIAVAEADLDPSESLGVRLSPDGTLALVPRNTSPRSYGLWDVAAMKEEKVFENVYHAEFSGSDIVTVGTTGVIVWTKNEDGTYTKGDPYMTGDAIFEYSLNVKMSPDRRFAVVFSCVGGACGVIQSDLDDRTEYEVITTISIAEDSSTIEVTNDHIYLLRSTGELEQYDLDGNLSDDEPPGTGAVVAPNGTQILYLGTSPQLVDLATENVVRTFTGHFDTVILARFSADGAYLVTAGDDDTIRVWEVATGEQIAPPVARETSTLVNLTLLADGSAVRITEGDGAVRTYRLRSLDELAQRACEIRFARQLTPAEQAQFGIDADHPCAESITEAQLLALAESGLLVDPAAVDLEAVVAEALPFSEDEDTAPSDDGAPDETAPVASATPIPFDPVEPTAIPFEAQTINFTSAPAPLTEGANSEAGWVTEGAWIHLTESREGGGWFANGMEQAALTWTTGVTVVVPQPTLYIWTSLEGASAQVFASTDQQTWTPLHTLAPDVAWHREAVDLSAYSGSTVWLRFVWPGGVGNWLIDEVAVTSFQPPTAIPLEDDPAPTDVPPPAEATPLPVGPVANPTVTPADVMPVLPTDTLPPAPTPVPQVTQPPANPPTATVIPFDT